jgi:OPA family glycerol-3-phosphate transporter-like MFS transporter
MSELPKWAQELVAIGGLLVVIAVVLRRLPRVDVGHSTAFRHRRVWNWLPLGLTYAFLYMGRYNINVAKITGLWTKEELGVITFWGALVYGCSFVINGPLADKYGGRRTILIAAVGAAVANVAMGICVMTDSASGNTKLVYSLLYAVNMYFQSFGAVSIVKVNAHWFHVRERGMFGGVFGILISLGIYFAYDWGKVIVNSDGGFGMPVEWVFFIPAIILVGFFVLDYFLVFDSPADAGHQDFDTADASSGDDGPRLKVTEVALRMLRNPIIVTIALIELCSGFIRGSIMKWTFVFMAETGQADSFAANHWGAVLCMAGILGGVFAGAISDKVFHSRRGPSAAILYAMAALSLGGAALLLGQPWVVYVLAFTILSVIGVHGMLSGTASADFGGKKNAGVAVGLIDGMVYLGFAMQANVMGNILPTGAEQSDATNWRIWVLVTLPFAVIGLLLAMRIWHAMPEAARRHVEAERAKAASPLPKAETRD